jgi:hypothetical protein
MAALMLLLVLGALFSCLTPCSAPVRSDDGSNTSAPNRVPTRVRLQLQPTPYNKLGTAGEYIRRQFTAVTTQQTAEPALVNAAYISTSCSLSSQQDPQPLRTTQGGQLQEPTMTMEAPAAMGTPAAARMSQCELASRPAPAAGQTGTSSGVDQEDRVCTAAAAVGRALAPDTPESTPCPDSPTSTAVTSAAAAAGDSILTRPPVAERSVHGACCSICLIDFEAPSVVLALPCTHVFHHECCVAWLLRSRLCPVCRADVVAGVAALNSTRRQ